MLCSNSRKKRETAQWLAWHYDVFIEIVDLKKVMSKRTLFCVNSAFMCKVWTECKLVGISFLSKTGPYNLRCCWGHSFTITALLCNVQYFYIFDTLYVTQQQEQQHTECIVVFPLQQWLHERVTWLFYTYVAYLVHICMQFLIPYLCVSGAGIAQSIYRLATGSTVWRS